MRTNDLKKRPKKTSRAKTSPQNPTQSNKTNKTANFYCLGGPNDSSGATKTPCPTGSLSATGASSLADCLTSCTDNIANGDETDVDCGGSCPSPCSDGLQCLVDGDCNSGSYCDANNRCNKNDCPAPGAPGACLNGGLCVDGDNGAFTCNCEGTAWHGATCEDPIDDCGHFPCHHGGTCVDLDVEGNSNSQVVQKYTCQCVQGTSGPDCHTILPGYYALTVNGTVFSCPGEF